MQDTEDKNTYILEFNDLDIPLKMGLTFGLKDAAILSMYFKYREHFFNASGDKYSPFPALDIDVMGDSAHLEYDEVYEVIDRLKACRILEANADDLFINFDRLEDFYEGRDYYEKYK